MSPSEAADTADTLLKIWGPAGAIILIQFAAIVVLFVRYARCQDKRVEEALRSAQEHTALAKELNTTLYGLTEAIHMMAERR